MDSPELTEILQKELNLSVLPAADLEEIRKALTIHINHLINNDFERLVHYLYRIDVDESKVRKLLSGESANDAATIIADLIIERQLQKIKSRREFNQRGNDIDENEKW